MTHDSDTQTVLLTLGSMARRLRVPSTWLRAEADAGRVPCLRAGRRLLFRPDIVSPIIAERAAQVQSPGGAS